MSWVTTISGRRWIEGGQSVQPRGEENVYTHLHFDGNSSLNGATATLRGKGWIRDEDEVVVIRSCGFGQDDERPRGHLVVIKEKRASRPVHSVTEELVGWNALIKQIRSGNSSLLTLFLIIVHTYSYVRSNLRITAVWPWTRKPC